MKLYWHIRLAFNGYFFGRRRRYRIEELERTIRPYVHPLTNEESRVIELEALVYLWRDLTTWWRPA